jgi:hypothetical protein
VTVKDAARTVLELRIRQRRLTFDEFTEHLEVFARENREVGTLSARHVQRLCAGKLTPNQLRAATARLLEKYFDASVEELLSAPEVSVMTVEKINRSIGETEDGVDRREFVGAVGRAVLGMTVFHPTLSSRAEETDWRHLLDRTARLRRLDNYLGGRDTYSIYASALAATAEYVRSVSCAPRVRTA